MSKRWFAGCALTILLGAFLLKVDEPERFTATFSIVAYDPVTGDLGVAVASKFPAVGAMVPYARAGVGAVATQAAANLRFGTEGLKLLESGLTPQQALEKLVENDPGRDDRQMGLVDARGRSAAWTGKGCFDFAGHIVGENYTVQGNILTGREVLVAMSQAFTSARGTLAERLMAALEAGDAAGGDQRGKESAALLVVREGAGYGGVGDRWVDLRVDDHAEPVKELRRLLDVHTLYFGETKELVPLTPELVRELQEILKRTGFYEGEVNGTYDEATRDALEDFQGWENLEMRFRKDNQIDKVVLDYMRQHYGQKK
jgi:uncharacterized Ntn-hydrolase superfamily protein